METARPPEAAAVLLLPHQMMSGRAAAAATGRPPRRVGAAPHEFYHGPARTSESDGPGGADAPPALFDASAWNQQGGGEFRAAPHEFYAGSVAWSDGSDDPVGDGLPPGLFDAAAWGQDDDGWFGGEPAAARAVVGLPETTAAAAGECCGVCLEAYAAGDAMRTMPCAHGFHGGCIVDWLAVSSFCPLCRFQLPTKEEDDDAAELAAYKLMMQN